MTLRQIVAAPARSLRDTPVVEGVPTGATVAVSSRPAKIRSSTDTRVEVAATGRAPGWLVLADLFHPGWKATVDGRATPIHTANAAFRAVGLPAGAHRVVFTYAPGRIIAAAWVSCAAFAGALLALLALTLPVRRRSGGVQTDEAT